ncbi:unnamed protein product [Caenorhabditis sp. 36 PRJEB53466]|nr:unnamed protein product [Caenorhabditis sp. 36 PRJEB53466]
MEASNGTSRTVQEVNHKIDCKLSREYADSQIKTKPASDDNKPMDIGSFYSEMSDELYLKHIKAVLDELNNRETLQTEKIPTTSSAVENAVSTSSSRSTELKEPKVEVPDEHFYVLTENATGIRYNYPDGNYTWNRPPVDDRYPDTNLLKRLNELNGYDMKNQSNQEADALEDPKADMAETLEVKLRKTSKPSASYWGKRGGDPFVDCACSICQMKFTTLRDLLDHRLQVHSQTTMLTCGFCDKRFQKRTHIFLHLSQEYNVYRCDACRISFSSKYHIDTHRCKEVISDTVTPKKQQEPRKRMSTEVATEPEDPAEEDDKQFHTCNRCGKRYTHYHWLEKHIEKCSGTNTNMQEEYFTCELCRRVYNSVIWFEKHKTKCFPQASPPPSPANVAQVPLQTVLRKSETTFCQNCHQKFSTQISLHDHLKSYDDSDMPVLVDNSNATNEESEDFEYREPSVDMFGIEPEASEKDYHSETIPPWSRNFNIKCSLCPVTVPNISQILHHRKNVHGIAAMLTCVLCSRQFNSLSTLRRHLSMEYSVFHCDKCGKNCVDRSSLYRHDCSRIVKNVNTKERDLKTLDCPKCHAKFANATILYSHRLKCESDYCNEQLYLEDSDERQPTSSNAYLRRIAFAEKAPMKDEMDEENETTSSNRNTAHIQTRLECVECPELLNTRSDLIRHRKECHGRDTFQCSFCFKKFQNYRALHDHHMIELEKFKCLKCGKLFGRKYLLAFHDGHCGQ